MAAAKHDILIEQGATFSQRITLKDGNLLPIDITGWTIRGQIRAQTNSSTIVETFNCSLLNQTTNTGQFDMELSASETAAITVDTPTSYDRKITYYVYDIEAVRTDNTVLRILEGVVKVSPEVTR